MQRETKQTKIKHQGWQEIMVVFLSGEAMGIILQFTEFSKLSLLRKHYVFKREKKTC